MSQHHHQGATEPSATRPRPMGGGSTVKDPVCGMDVPSDGALRAEFAGKTYVFCGRRCLERFEREPAAFVGEQPKAPIPQAPAAVGGAPQWAFPIPPQLLR